MQQSNTSNGQDNIALSKMDDVQLLRYIHKKQQSHGMCVNSKAGVYSYDERGHIPQKKSAAQQRLLEEFAEYMDKDNEDILLIPAWDAVQNGFGPCRDNGNPYALSSNLSIAKGRNYMRQGRDINSYSMVVQSKVPNIK